MGEKKKTLNIGSLVKSLYLIMEFIMKLSSLMTLASFIVFRDSFRLENQFNGLVNEI